MLTLTEDELYALYVLLSRKAYTWDELEVATSFKHKLTKAVKDIEKED